MATDLRAPATVELTENRFVRGSYIRQPRDLPIEGRAIVVNTGTVPAYPSPAPRRPLPPFSSTILIDTTIATAESVLILRPGDGAAGAAGAGAGEIPADLAAITHEPGWVRLGDVVGEHSGPGRPFPPETPLWRGPQDRLDVLEFDPGALLGAAPTGPCRFDLRVNLWFAPAGTDCGIHVVHPFIEVHTQVFGTGRMQKFHRQDHATGYEDVVMSPGYTTPVPFCAPAPGGDWVYPWHQYRADTDCVWLALEYHARPAGDSADGS
jgi:hypothetical protein